MRYLSDNYTLILISERQCGGILKQREGTIVSPGFPFGYPQPITCLWIIRVPSAIRISLKADSFDIYSTENCIKDHVTLFNKGYYSPGDGTTRYCGKVFNQKVFDGSEVWVEFSTNEVRPAPGFSLAYRAEFEAPTGRPAITRPGNYTCSKRF